MDPKKSFTFPAVIDELKKELFIYFEHHEKFHLMLGKFSNSFLSEEKKEKEKLSNPVPSPESIELELKHCISRLQSSNSRFADGLQKLNSILVP